MDIFGKLEGSKTYICVLLMIVAGLCNKYVIIDTETYKLIMSMLIPMALATIRMGLKKTDTKAEEAKQAAESIKGLNIVKKLGGK
jgi:hypothetical protein